MLIILVMEVHFACVLLIKFLIQLPLYLWPILIFIRLMNNHVIKYLFPLFVIGIFYYVDRDFFQHSDVST